MTAQISRRRLLALGAAMPLAGGITALLPGLSSPVSAAVIPSGATSFGIVAPTRIVDTRPDTLVNGFTRIDANTIRVPVAGHGGVPVGATAAVLNVTIANTVRSYVTVFPAGSPRPQASSVNVDGAGVVTANLVTVQLSASGEIDVFHQYPGDIIVDVSGAYSPATAAVSAGRFVGLAASARVLDTRESPMPVAAGSIKRVSLASVVPATATAVVVNLTITEPTGLGYWTAFAAGAAMPSSSNVNVGRLGQITANQAIIPVGAVESDRGIDVFSMAGGHLVVDVAGYFTGAADELSADGLFVPSAPTRVLDTRAVAKYGRLHAGWVAEFDFSGRPQAQAVAVNLTTAETRGAGFFTGYPARTVRPLASNLNATGRDEIVSNHAILRTSTDGVAVFAQTGGQLIVDVAGFYTGTPAATTTAAPDNVVPVGSPLNWRLVIPTIGVDATVVEGLGTNVTVDGNVGHADGTGLLGQDDKNILLFANRASNGSVFRNIHKLGDGDIIVFTGADGRTFQYVFARRDLTAPTSEAAYTASRAVPTESVSLVASSKSDFGPGSLDHYIVVSFTKT